MKHSLKSAKYAFLTMLVSSVGFAGTSPTKCTVLQPAEGAATSNSSLMLTQKEVNLDDGQHHIVYQENGMNYGVQKDSQGGLQLSIYNPISREIVALAYATEGSASVTVMGSKPLRALSCTK